jgi:hypothetical protein
VEAVWVRTGTEADYLGHDVKGKAVVLMRGPRTNRRLAQRNGAVAQLVVNALPGNLKLQNFPVPSKMPRFSIGTNDVAAIHDLIAQAGSAALRVRIRLDAGLVEGLKTATVWGTLPGVTDETIYVCLRTATDGSKAPPTTRPASQRCWVLPSTLRICRERSDGAVYQS